MYDHWPCLAFYVNPGDLNWGPYSCDASSLSCWAISAASQDEFLSCYQTEKETFSKGMGIRQGQYDGNIQESRHNSEEQTDNVAEDIDAGF